MDHSKLALQSLQIADALTDNVEAGIQSPHDLTVHEVNAIVHAILYVGDQIANLTDMQRSRS